MSFFNKIFASVGIGAATVDTKLEKSSYQAGETAKGVVEITGGSTSQTIDSIYLTLYTTYIRESDDKKYTDYAPIQKVQISEPFTIGENEKKEIPFSFTLPFETPITYGNTRVWVATGLDIKNSVDPKDKDYIEILPNSLINAILQSVQELGFRIRKVECEQAPRRFRGRYPFIQEFEFVPVNGQYQRSLDEIELMFLNQSEDQTDLLIEVDRRARGLGGFLAEALEMDESMVRITVRSSDLPNLSSKLKETISRFA
ncbi:sporulation protein [Rossellomorea oryzaecorticis]|uniref:Sporulation protein n=1 Tax=Rossellomorea oryzaecorticis TaxID=1396505 RepID=A0ABU9KDW8_9BACI